MSKGELSRGETRAFTKVPNSTFETRCPEDFNKYVGLPTSTKATPAPTVSPAAYADNDLGLSASDMARLVRTADRYGFGYSAHPSVEAANELASSTSLTCDGWALGATTPERSITQAVKLGYTKNESRRYHEYLQSDFCPAYERASDGQAKAAAAEADNSAGNSSSQADNFTGYDKTQSSQANLSCHKSVTAQMELEYDGGWGSGQWPEGEYSQRVASCLADS